MLATGSPIKVRKLRPDGSQAYAWEGVVLHCDESGIVLRAFFNVDFRDLGYTTFRRGDEFIEFYYFDPDGSPSAVRYYNVFQISSPDGTLKGWYCNLGLPAQLDPRTCELSYVDLELDVWANPDGTFVVLDEDELEVLLQQHPELTAAARQGQTDLINLARSGCLPRWPDRRAA
jgi:protein associated with RNAse G/E